jgi:[ribosomal protein S5]-alanine N-acetyltransferase
MSWASQTGSVRDEELPPSGRNVSEGVVCGRRGLSSSQLIASAPQIEQRPKGGTRTGSVGYDHAMPDEDFLAHGPRVAIRRVTFPDYAELSTLTRASAQLHHPWVPTREISPEAFREYISRFDQATHEGFLVCLRQTGSIVGGININNIVRGTIQSGALGYVAFASTTGHGYMTEGLQLIMRLAFSELGLHRLEALIQPANKASVRLVERLGFQREGFSPHYQFLDGAWQGHERWALTTEMTDTHTPDPRN